MNIFFKKCKKIFIQEVFWIIIIIIPLFFPSSWIELIKKIFESMCSTTINQDITEIIVKIVLIAAIYIFILKFNSNKEFFNGDIYGDIPFCFYYIARLLGYKKLSLKRKPYNIQFKVLKKDLFEIIEDDEEKDENVNVKIDKSNFRYSKNMRECNLIIADTYPIKKNQIPVNKRNLDSIWIQREKSDVATRVYSPKLITAVSENVALIQNSGGKINLFLTTSHTNTKKIIKDVFMKGDRSNYNIEIFLQESKGNRPFKDKGIKV